MERGGIKAIPWDGEKGELPGTARIYGNISISRALIQARVGHIRPYEDFVKAFLGLICLPLSPGKLVDRHIHICSL